MNCIVDDTWTMTHSLFKQFKLNYTQAPIGCFHVKYAIDRITHYGWKFPVLIDLIIYDKKSFLSSKNLQKNVLKNVLIILF